MATPLPPSQTPTSIVRPVLLPPNVEPLAYTLTLTPNLTTFTFDGVVSILVNVKLPNTTSITLHARDLDINPGATFTPSADGTPLTFSPLVATGHFIAYKPPTMTLNFASALPEGEGTLRIAFRGVLNDQMAGFYRSKYTTAEGETRYMASTQFEALDARRCFPCWDEPARKATFAATLVVPADRTAFSNMPVLAETLLADGTKRITFAPTPKMSTYLLAFVVGEFDFLQAFTSAGVAVRVYTPPGQTEKGRFGLEVAVKSLEFYDEYYGSPYPLPKLDMVAVPEFAMGAMENWGLVTYRAIDLLIDFQNASSSQKQRVCSVVTHELAHQWFGNLVTMEWWNDLWLNEGFASWMQTASAAEFFPEWQLWTQFCSSNLGGAMGLDALRTSHPIQVPIAHAEEVEQVFDAISYFKGSAVVRMIYAVLGKADFKRGLRAYFKRHAYGNTTTLDLWNAWENASGKPIGLMMSSWTEQMGFPQLTVKRVAGDAGALSITQSWFLADGSGADEDAPPRWTIPLFVASAAEQLPTMYGVYKAADGERPYEMLVDATGWVKLNAGQHVMARVLYADPAMWDDLIAACAASPSPLAAEDRVALLSDAYAFAKAGQLDPAIALRLVGACAQDTDATVWEQIEGLLGAFDSALSADDAMHAGFCSFAASTLAALGGKVGWTPDPASDGHMTRKLRAVMLRLLAKFSATDDAVAAQAQALFETPDAISADLRGSIFKIALKSSTAGSPEEDARHAALMARFNGTEDPALRKEVMLAIGNVPSAALKRSVMAWTATENKIQDFFYPMASVAGSDAAGRDIAWEYMCEHWGDIRGRVEDASASLTAAVVAFCTRGFATRAKADEIEAFFVANPCEAVSRKVAQVVESIRIKAAFFEKSVMGSDLATAKFWAELTGSVLERNEESK